MVAVYCVNSHMRCLNQKYCKTYACAVKIMPRTMQPFPDSQNILIIAILY